MQNVGRVMLFVTVVVMAAFDIWLGMLRCASSPSIDWSRLGFALAIQAAVLVSSLVLLRVRATLAAPVAWRLELGMLAAAAVTFILVRQPLLLNDTTFDKFYASGSYKCPGVPATWKHGI
jgi:hypothetical protein